MCVHFLRILCQGGAMSRVRGRRAVVGWVAIAALVGLSPGPARAMQTSPPPRGAVVFSTARDGIAQIYVINADGTGLRRLSPGGGADTHPVVSPDGRHIAFSEQQRAADVIHYVR